MDLETTVLEAIQMRFREVFDNNFRLNEPMDRYTSARVGGSAEMFVIATTVPELHTAVELAYLQHIPYTV
ncbi:MAG: hypothetical protein AMJ56_14005, partial [Anaerolineae bacterium SG8_19]